MAVGGEAQSRAGVAAMGCLEPSRNETLPEDLSVAHVLELELGRALASPGNERKEEKEEKEEKGGRFVVGESGPEEEDTAKGEERRGEERRGEGVAQAKRTFESVLST